MFSRLLSPLALRGGKATTALTRTLIRAYTQHAAYILEDMVSTRQTRQQNLTDITLDQAVANLSAASSPTHIHQPVSLKHAAVLVPLFQAADGSIHVVLTQRSNKLNTHAGEVSFPGGKRDPSDPDDIHTALREAHEELGLPPSLVTVITTLPPVLSKHLLSVTPVIATVPADLRFTPNPTEVESVFTAPLSMFLEAGHGYSFRDLVWKDGHSSHPYRIHSWQYEYKENESYLIWGLTAGMLILVAEKAFGVSALFEVHAPHAPPYTALAFEKGRIVFRGAPQGADKEVGGVGSSAAVEGATVLDEEAYAAVGGCEPSSNNGTNSDK